MMSANPQTARREAFRAKIERQERTRYVVKVTNGITIRPDLTFQTVSHKRALAKRAQREGEGHSVKLLAIHPR